MTLPEEIRPRVANLIRRLSTSSDGEIVATVYALRRIADVHKIAECIETPVTKDQLSKIYEAAYAEGIAAADRQNGADGFHNSTEELSWIDVALFVQCNRHHTDSNHHKFIDDMAERAKSPWPREPTVKQHQYLHSLYSQIRRKIS